MGSPKGFNPKAPEFYSGPWSKSRQTPKGFNFEICVYIRTEIKDIKTPI